MAVEDFGAAAKGMKVEIVGADHQNKPDVGSNIARTWFDVDKVDVIVDVPTSSRRARRQRDRAREEQGVPGLGRRRLRSDRPEVLAQHRALDLRHLGARQRHRRAMVKTGGDTWFFITADYAFGKALERDTAEVVEANGGKVLGQVRHPFPGTDFSSFLLQAQASKAKVIGLANAGGDTINSVKQAAEFGIAQGGQNLAGLLVFITDVHALGLQTAQGLVLTEIVLLGSRRRQPRVREALRATVQGQHADHGAGRRLCGGAALSEGASRRSRAMPTARRWSPR